MCRNDNVDICSSRCGNIYIIGRWKSWTIELDATRGYFKIAKDILKSLSYLEKLSDLKVLKLFKTTKAHSIE